jgi:hypothetical protein
MRNPRKGLGAPQASTFGSVAPLHRRVILKVQVDGNIRKAALNGANRGGMLS